MTIVPLGHSFDTGTRVAALSDLAYKVVRGRVSGQSMARDSSSADDHVRVRCDWVRDLVPKLRELTRLEPNWDSYDAVAPNPALLGQVLLTLDAAGKAGVVSPNLVPTIEGGVQLEWYLSPRELEIEFRADGGIEYLATDTAEDGSDSGQVEAPHVVGAIRRLLDWISGG